MQVLPSTLEYALFNCYRLLACDALAVETSDLADEWRSTGLRHSDYLTAMEAMATARLLRVSNRAQRALVELTPAGLEHCEQRHRLTLRNIRDRFTLLRLQWRLGRRALTARRRLRRRRGSDRGPRLAQQSLHHARSRSGDRT